MDHMAALRRTKKYFFKWTHYLTLPDSWPQHFFEILAKTAEKRDVIDLVDFSCDVPLMLNVCLLSAAPTVAFHHITNPMYILFAPCPNRIAHHIY